MTTRREFLTSCSLLAATAVVKPTNLFSAPCIQPARPTDRLCLADFASQVGTTFRVVRRGQRAVRLELAEARARPDARLRGGEAMESGQHRFALLFRSASGSHLGQNTHDLDHPALGRMMVFLVPVLSRDTTRRYYEAIFNRHIEPLA